MVERWLSRYWLPPRIKVLTGNHHHSFCSRKSRRATLINLHLCPLSHIHSQVSILAVDLNKIWQNRHRWHPVEAVRRVARTIQHRQYWLDKQPYGLASHYQWSALNATDKDLVLMSISSFERHSNHKQVRQRSRASATVAQSPTHLQSYAGKFDIVEFGSPSHRSSGIWMVVMLL